MNYRNTTASVSTHKVDRPIGVESALEKDFAIILDFDVNVLKFEEQPLTIRFQDSYSNWRKYTPDFLVHYRDDIIPAKNMKSILCEIKYRSDLFKNWSILKPKFKAARLIAKENNWEFRIITENEIRTPYLNNAKFLRRFRSGKVDWRHFDTINQMLDDFRVITPQGLLAAYSNDKLLQAEILPTIWHMIANRTIKTDLTLPLNMQSEIWMAI